MTSDVAVAASCWHKRRGRTIILYNDDARAGRVFNAGEALRNAVEQIESSSNDEAGNSLRRLKYFLPSVLFIKY